MEFNDKIVRVGTITVACAIMANFLPGLYLWVAYGVLPTFHDLIVIWTTMAAAFGVSWIVQPLSYFGSLGTAGSYIAWIAGSAADIRIPAVTMAQKIANLEPNTPKGDVMAALALATSVFVSVSIITIFAIGGTSLIPMLPEVVKTGFNYILPSLFAAVYTSMTLKDHSQGIIIVLIGLAMLFVMPMVGIPGGLNILMLVLMGMFVSKFIYKARHKD